MRIALSGYPAPRLSSLRVIPALTTQPLCGRQRKGDRRVRLDLAGTGSRNRCAPAHPHQEAFMASFLKVTGLALAATAAIGGGASAASADAGARCLTAYSTGAN